MNILPIRTPLLHARDTVAAILAAHASFEDNDIVVVSSKVLATAEGRVMNLEAQKPSERARTLAPTCGQDPHFTELVLRETERMHGTIVGTCPFALLTSLRPTGMQTGRILCPNAGLDQSNVAKGFVVGWPENPLKATMDLQASLEKKSKRHLAVILTDSCCRPARAGVVAFALVCVGIDPIRNEAGKKDLFGKPLRFTQEAIADQLATAANAVMGNAGQSIPAAIIRDHGLALSNFSGWVNGIDPKEDLFREAFMNGKW